MRAIESVWRSCPICDARQREVVLELTPTPLGDHLERVQEHALQLPTFPLSVAKCRSCDHVYLPLVVSPDASYSDYHFETSQSPRLSETMKTLAGDLQRRGLVADRSFVVDIGSNDGTWLGLLQSQGCKVLGIEPSSRHAQEATSRGIPTVDRYFSQGVAEEILETHGQPDLVTANYVAANIPNLHDFFAGVATLIGEYGSAAILTGYHPDQFGVNMFDFVYHEHLSYFTVADFDRMSAEYDLTITSAIRNSVKGGSLHITMRKRQGDSVRCQDVDRLLQRERWLGVTTAEWFESLSGRISDLRQAVHASLQGLGKPKIAGYGMSHSVTTLMYHFGLVDLISYLVDDNPARQGLFAPGGGAPIRSPEVLRNDSDVILMIMAWQHDDLIQRRLMDLGWQGPVLQPLPSTSLLTLGG